MVKLAPSSASAIASRTTLSGNGSPSGRGKPKARQTTCVPGGGRSARSIRICATHIAFPRSISHHGSGSGSVGAIHGDSGPGATDGTATVDCRV
jgi:hypothetical protein